jgi:tetratricopeptide (TPR) repeat protein
MASLKSGLVQAGQSYSRGRAGEAAAQCRGLLKRFADHPQVLALLGAAELQLGQIDDGLAHLRRSLEGDPVQPAVWSNLGQGHIRRQEFAEALACFDRALALDPKAAAALFNRANALAGLQRTEDALAAYDQVLAIAPDLAEAHNNRGYLLREAGRGQEALHSFERAVAANPHFPNAQLNLGNALCERKRYQEALPCFERALADDPNLIEAHLGRGKVLRRLKRFQEALSCFDQLLARLPDHADAGCNRAWTLMALDRPGEALVGAIRVLSRTPDHVDAHGCRGAALLRLGRLAEAIKNFDYVLERDPAYAEIANARGVARMAAGDLAAALVDMQNALAAEPDNAKLHMNRAMCLLLSGNYADGFAEYEWRLRDEDHPPRTLPQPRWDGGVPLAGRSLLVTVEQGLGDFVQFCRYLPRAAQDGTLVVETPVPLLPLMASLAVPPGRGRFFPVGEALPATDLVCPLMSLPHAFSARLETVADTVPYLAVEPARRAHWRTRLGERTRPRIGLCWSGNRDYVNDRFRSMTLAQIAPLLRLPCDFHALQIVFRDADAKALAAWPNLSTHVEALHDFADTAALIAEMDLVVTIDTAVAHIAGALGKTVWILLPFSADWRWMLNRCDSPWYPTATLFRQRAVGDWRGPVAEATAKLAEQFALPTPETAG